MHRAGVRPRHRVTTLLLVSSLALAGCPGSGIAPEEQQASRSEASAPLRFLGETIIEPGSEGPPIGGLSGISYRGDEMYLVVSDDRGEYGPARLYSMRISLVQDELPADGVEVVGWIRLLDASGAPFEQGTYDFEGVVAVAGELLISSEGNADAGIGPSVFRFDAEGNLLGELTMPDGLVPSPDGTRGARQNLGFEALGISPSGRFLFTSTENALRQDGPEASESDESPSRLLRFSLDDGDLASEHLYIVDPVHTAPSQETDVAVNGLVEILPVSDVQMLALERSFVTDTRHSIKLYDVCLAGADDISGIDSLLSTDISTIRPVDKRLIIDLADLDLSLDNLEGMTFGPELASGERTLIIVSDDNFAPQRQVTQILAFALDPGVLRECPVR